ncbi:phosphotransferase enzyme family protein [Actinomadura kijaniata]|uniref:phosphotransferase enzyme family protein n=1 Tax=Actinomadura kijaniata TaxID=46161 RepID=UPI0008315ECE|nr:phosphotransferase [Actinomadura kijaniata]
MPTSQSACDTDPTPSRLPRRWDLAEARVSGPVAEGRDRRCWRVDSGDGPFLLAEYPRPDRRRLLFQHEVTAALDAAGLPVLAPVPARTGRTLVTAGGHGFVLYSWVSGRRRGGLELTYGQCEALGELLGRLHAELDACTPPVQQSMLVPTPRAADAAEAVDALLDSVPDDGTDFAALTGRRLRERRALLDEYADFRPPELDVSTVGHLHGSFGPGCLRYGGSGNVTAVLGWDSLTTGPVAGELVRAAVALFTFEDDRGLDLERVQSFVRGHRAAFPLDAGQIQGAVHREWWERLCDVRPLRHRYLGDDPAGGTGGDRGSAGAAGLVAWWSANLDRTLEVFPAPYAAPAEDSPAYG